MDILELVDWGLRAAVKTRELEVFSLERRRLRGTLSVCIHTWWGAPKNLKPDSSDRWQDKSQQRQTEIDEIALKHKNIFIRVVKDWMRCLEMLWTLCPLKPNRAGPWAIYSILPCSEQRELDCMICRKPFPPATILRFCDSAVSSTLQSTLWCLPLQPDLQKVSSEGWQICGGCKGEIWNSQTQMLSNEGLDGRANHKSKYVDLCQCVKSEF